MEEEMDSMAKFKTWTLEDMPEDNSPASTL
jgi:hypothetical protein